MEELKSQPEITKLIKQVAHSKGIENFTITNVETNAKGEGYMGVIYLVQGTETDTSRTFDVVIKAAFKDEKVRTAIPIRMCFKNEIHAYNHVLPSYQKLMQDHNITNPPEFGPQCFKVCLDETVESLALENLKVSGFEVFNKKDVVDKEHIEKIFQIYGQFHACSFALRDQKPEEYKRVVDKIYNIYEELLEVSVFGDHLKNLTAALEPTVMKGEKFQKYMGSSLLNILKETITTECDHSVILHGDCWSNNMMFKYQEVEGHKKLIDVRLIDFQIVKQGSPVCDLSYCLFSGASKDVFDNLDYFLEVYHNSLSSFLKELGSDPEKLFPFATLKEHWRKYAKFGLIMALSLIKMKMTDSADIVDFSDGLDFEEMSEKIKNMKCDTDTYERRVQQILEHLSEVDAL